VTDPSEPIPQFILIPEEHQQWVMQTYRARRCDLVLKQSADPNPQNLLHRVDRFYELGKGLDVGAGVLACGHRASVPMGGPGSPV
jgi:hypothetical protein